MGKAARAIIIENNQILLMKRLKYGKQYYTLVGGRLNDGESPEQAVKREVKEETGLDVTSAKLVFGEKHPEPYNDQFIFVCEVAEHGEVSVQPESEEARMNRMEANIHQPEWVALSSFGKIQFSTMKLQTAIVEALKKGFPEKPTMI